MSTVKAPMIIHVARVGGCGSPSGGCGIGGIVGSMRIYNTPYASRQRSQIQADIVAIALSRRRRTVMQCAIGRSPG